MNERVIFDAALEITDSSARRAFIEKSCAGKPGMLAAVETLLKSHDAAGSFLNVPIGKQVQPDLARGDQMKSDSTKNDDAHDSIPSNDPSDKTHIYESEIHHKDDDADDESAPDLSFLQPSSKPGSIGFLGHYEVLKVLGQGGFGVVMKAFDEKLHRHVAIKVMNAQMAATSPPRKRFLREARAAAAIRHENIVQVYSVEEQPLPYLVMEFIDGQTLQQKQAGHGPLEVPEWLHIGRQLAAGLTSAHATGLIHRDIKPGNILLEQGAEQKVKITDFGLARAADDASLSRSGTISGTPMYMAPEQALGHTLDHRADLFSMGSVLYELATGRPPFRAANTVAVLRRVVDDTPRPMQEIIPELPNWLVAIVNKLLEKQPDHRFQTAKEVALLLDRCQSELQLTGQVTCVNVGHNGNARTSLYQPVVKSTAPATGVAAQHVAPAAWEGSQNLVSFVGTCLLFTLITAGAVWWGQALTGWSRPLLHGLIAVGAGLTIVLAWIAESISSRQQRPGRAQYWGGIIAAACLFTVGNVVTLKWSPQSMTPVAERQVLAPAADSGLRFDGKDDFVKVGPFDLSSPQYTLEAFVTSASDGDNGVIALLKSDGKDPELMYLYDGYPAKVRTSGAGIIGQRPYQTVNAPLRNGTREHRALVVDGQVMHYFVNGIWQGKRYCSARKGLMWEMREIYIGCKANETEFFRGRIDQLRLSKIARYSSNFAPVTSVASDDSTLALYNFDEGEGDVLKDASGNGHDGKIVGATWVKPNSPSPSSSSSNNPQPPTLDIASWHGWPADAPPLAIAPFNAEQAQQHQAAWAKYLVVPVEYTNSLGMKFRLIPPGEFMMGSTPAEIEAALKVVYTTATHWHECIRSEAPQHKVILTQPIFLGIHEVTQAEYEKVMGANPSHFAPNGSGKEAVAGMDTSNHPIEKVSWNDAAEFCAKLSQQEKLKPSSLRDGAAITPLDGTGYRLPCEAEWEFACRAGTTTKYWIGDKDEDLERAGWFGVNSGNRTHAAGELKANPFGLFDIHGNVWEWVQDGWNPSSYGGFQQKPAINPSSPSSSDTERVVRGGRWYHSASYCRSSVRLSVAPTDQFDDLGFRMSLPVDAVKAAIANRSPMAQTANSGWHGWLDDAPKPAIAPFTAEQAQQHQAAWAQYLKVPVEYTNSLGMKFRLVPPGEFMMGSTKEEIEEAYPVAGNDLIWREHIRSEAPRHKVVLTRPVYVGMHEVTQAQYEKVMGAHVSYFSATGIGRALVSGLDSTGSLPVETVSWNDAAGFCAKLSEAEQRKPVYSRTDDTVTQLEGNGYQLPTEATWEFACRAGTTTKLWSGDEDEPLLSAAWFKTNAFNRTHPVGELKANPFGLHDTHGNVWEWVQDHWDVAYYDQFADKPATDPTGPSTAAGSRHGLRGGDWVCTPSSCRASHRHVDSATARLGSVGFRVVLPVDAAIPQK